VTRAVAVAAATLLSLSGCSTVLQPARPLLVQGPVRAQALELRRAPFTGPAGGELVLTLRLSGAPSGASYAGARLVSDFAPECGGRGALARRVEVVAGGSLRPLSSEVTFALHFPFLASAPTRGASRVDVTIATPTGSTRCLALPVTLAAPARDWQPTTQLTWSSGVAGEWRFASRGVSSLVTVPLSLGTWLGPVHPALELGLPLGRCQRCAGDTELADDSGVPLHVAGAVDTWLLSDGQLVLGLGVAYRASSVWAPGDGGTRFAWLHGPQLRPRIALTPPAPFNPERGRALAVPHVGLELPLGYAWDARGRGAATVGIALCLGGAF
jgi:hypothetical protein